MIIRLANKDDCLEVAKLHVQEIKSGFLSELGEKFLDCFYQKMTDSQNAFLIVAQQDNSIIGFVSGCLDLKKFYKEFAKKYSFRVLPILFKKFLGLDSLKKILETRKYIKREEKALPKPELISIAVFSQFQGQGVAQQLLFKFFSEMKNKEAKLIKVIVGEKLSPAIRFYEKNGFKLHSKIFVHKDRPSRIYIYKL